MLHMNRILGVGLPVTAQVFWVVFIFFILFHWTYEYLNEYISSFLTK